jgi:hypothetical protein
VRAPTLLKLNRRLKLPSRIGKAILLSLVEGLGHCASDQRKMPGWLLPTAADSEAALRIAAACIQAVGAEVMAAFVAAQQALAQNALLAVMAERDVAALDQVQFAPVYERRFAGEVQRDHGKSIEAWKLLTVAST